MAKDKKPAKSAKSGEANDGWPHLQAAFFCGQVLEDKDRVFSAIRIVDHLHLPPKPEPPLGQLIAMPVTMFIAMKSGDAVGERELVINLTTPSGKRSQVAHSTAKFEGGASGIVTRTPMIPLLYEGAGVYWYTLRVSGRLGKRTHGWRVYTRMPLRLSFQEAQPPAEAPHDAPVKKKR